MKANRVGHDRCGWSHRWNDFADESWTYHCLVQFLPGSLRIASKDAKGCVSIDIQSLGVKPSPVAFALEVKGDSMIGKHIAPGDLVVFEPRAEPKACDVVAALIDGESTLKTFMTRNGKPYLRAENPRYPDLSPAQELVIQGVMVALIRKRK